MVESERTDRSRTELLRRGSRIGILSIAWDAGGAAVAIAAGVVSDSIVLVGFGGISVIGLVAAVAVYARLRGELHGLPPAALMRRQRRAMRVIGVSFFLLAGYIGESATRDLVSRTAPDESPLGIALAILSLLVLPVLAWRKYRIGRRLDSPALVADAKAVAVHGYLSLALLTGLGLNLLRGWWWADPLAALAMLPLVVYQGSITLRRADGPG